MKRNQKWSKTGFFYTWYFITSSSLLSLQSLLLSFCRLEGVYNLVFEGPASALIKDRTNVSKLVFAFTPLYPPASQPLHFTFIYKMHQVEHLYLSTLARMILEWSQHAQNRKTKMYSYMMPISADKLTFHHDLPFRLTFILYCKRPSFMSSLDLSQKLWKIYLLTKHKILTAVRFAKNKSFPPGTVRTWKLNKISWTSSKMGILYNKLQRPQECARKYWNSELRLWKARSRQ